LNAEPQSNIREPVSIESRVLYPAYCRNSLETQSPVELMRLRP